MVGLVPAILLITNAQTMSHDVALPFITLISTFSFTFAHNHENITLAKFILHVLYFIIIYFNLSSVRSIRHLFCPASCVLRATLVCTILLEYVATPFHLCLRPYCTLLNIYYALYVTTEQSTNRHKTHACCITSSVPLKRDRTIEKRKQIYLLCVNFPSA